MPCEQCEEGLYRWGENGECMYETLEDCQLANQDTYLEETLKPTSDVPIDFTMHFTKEQMEELHGEGEVLIEVEGNEEGETMNILFTYDREEDGEEEREEEREYGELTAAMLDDELDEYIDKLTDSIKKI
jgi:hypothetical protein